MINFLQRTLKSFFLGWLKHALSKIVKEGKDCLLRVDGRQKWSDTDGGMCGRGIKIFN